MWSKFVVAIQEACTTHKGSQALTAALDCAGVLTKLDIMDPGTDAREVLNGWEVKLKHGWVAVVNRGQQDIDANASMQVTSNADSASR